MQNKEVMKQYLLEAFPNPERKGCPDEDALEALIELRQPADYSTLLHVGSCSDCYQEYLHLHREWAEQSESRGNAGAMQSAER